MKTYLVSAYFPGCLPDSEPHGSSDFSEALEMLVEDIRFFAEYSAETDEEAAHFLQVALNVSETAQQDAIYVYDVAGMTYALELVEHTHTYDSQRSAWQCATCDSAVEDCYLTNFSG